MRPEIQPHRLVCTFVHNETMLAHPLRFIHKEQKLPSTSSSGSSRATTHLQQLNICVVRCYNAHAHTLRFVGAHKTDLG